MFRSAASCIRIEIFDRSMTIAAQFFTSVFPILILIATWVNATDTSRLAEAINLPEESVGAGRGGPSSRPRSALSER